jgi:hypothetical protein
VVVVALEVPYLVVFDCEFGEFYACHDPVGGAFRGFGFYDAKVTQVTHLLEEIGILLGHVTFRKADDGAVVGFYVGLDQFEALFEGNVVD